MKSLLTILLVWWGLSFCFYGWVSSPFKLIPRLWRPLWRGILLYWRHGWKNQYERRGFMHACGHAITVLVILATIGTLTSPAPQPWGTVALWWIITIVYWLLLMQWHRLRKRKRQLPRRHWW